jgi:hypothetical protein
MKHLISIIVTTTILLYGCKDKSSGIYNSGHNDKPPREWIPEPDLVMRLKSMYSSTTEKKRNGEIVMERYLAYKKFGGSIAETDVELGRNNSGQIVFLEEYILDRYADKTLEIIQTYFFDEYGSVFAIEQHTNSICDNSDVHQTMVKYYNADFKLIDNTYKIEGASDEELDKKKCGSEFDETLGISFTYKELLETYESVMEKK